MIKKQIISCVVLFTFMFCYNFSYSQHSHNHSRVINFPDVPGFKVLKCDFHQHTVFSDGSVWPSIRVEEALKDGLDAISITEHLEYQPHKNDIPHPDRNRSFDIAKSKAKNTDLIIVHGAEITRSMPPGHTNAIFITDANKLLMDDPIEVFKEAKSQGAFIFWNHPNWTAQKKDGIATLTDMHKKLIEEKLLNGIEVVNEQTYSDEALQIAEENNLTVMGTSDIHGFVDWKFNIPQGGHRPITLVFAKEKSESGIKEGLEKGRTVVWFDNILIGKKENVLPLIDASINVKEAKYIGDTFVLSVSIENNSDAEFILQNKSPFTFHSHNDIVVVKPNDITVIEVKTLDKKSSLELPFEVLNTAIAPNKHLIFNLKIEVKQSEE